MPAIWSFNSAQHQLQGVIKFKFVNFKLFYPIFLLFVGSLSLLRILLKQNTALLSHVSQSVSHRRDISSFLDNLIV